MLQREDVALRGRPFNSWGGGGWGGEVGDHQVFPFFPISFLLHLYCTQFFSSDKRLQEICFQNHPPRSRVKWSTPTNQLTYLLHESTYILSSRVSSITVLFFPLLFQDRKKHPKKLGKSSKSIITFANGPYFVSKKLKKSILHLT